MKLGVIGMGGRARGFVNTFIRQERGAMLCAVADVDIDGAKKRMADVGIPTDDVHFYGTADEMLAAEALDGVLLATRCSLHARLAVKVMEKGIPLLLEKPVATSREDVQLLEQAWEQFRSPVLVSFPLRVTPLAKLAKEIVDSGRIGTVEQVQAVNNVPYGGTYYHAWHRDEIETGGLFLQKATHDFDYITHILGQEPVSVCAMTAKQIFTGDKPAGLRCVDCDEYLTCNESPYTMKHFNDEQRVSEEWGITPWCCFAKDTGNEDSGSAIVRYASGMHVCYTQNFFARKGAAARGARFLGYKGTLEFDWYRSELKVFMHHTARTETYSLKTASMGHSGGDDALALNFIAIVEGKADSVAPLSEGIRSVRMCLAAKTSAQTQTFQTI